MTALIVKIGGSLFGTSELTDCLNRVVRSRRQIVVVPGGGIYADKVRSDQQRLNIPDADAHRLAIFAMHGLGLAAQRDEIESIWAAGQVPVWLPWTMVEGAADLPQDWSVTSDGLGAWLAKELSADVALLKSCPIPAASTLDRLAETGIADPTFVKLVKKHRLAWHVLAANDAAQLTELIG